MSLINDALKQASQHQKQNRPPPSPLQMRDADESPRRSYTPPAILFAVLLVVLALGGVLVGYALQKRSAEQVVVNARHENPPPQPESPAAPETVAPATPANRETTLVWATNHPAYVASPAPTPGVTPPAPPVPETNVVAAPVEPPPPVGPKLQGISYNPSRPSAVVNGRTVYAGDKVAEFRVTQISPDTVTLVSDAETKVLSLSQ